MKFRVTWCLPLILLFLASCQQTSYESEVRSSEGIVVSAKYTASSSSIQPVVGLDFELNVTVTMQPVTTPETNVVLFRTNKNLEFTVDSKEMYTQFASAAGMRVVVTYKDNYRVITDEDKKKRTLIGQEFISAVMNE